MSECTTFSCERDPTHEARVISPSGPLPEDLDGWCGYCDEHIKKHRDDDQMATRELES